MTTVARPSPRSTVSPPGRSSRPVPTAIPQDQICGDNHSFGKAAARHFVRMHSGSSNGEEAMVTVAPTSAAGDDE